MPILYRDPSAPDAAPEYRVHWTSAGRAVLLDASDDAWSCSSTIAWGPDRYRTSFRALWNASGLFVRFDARDDAPWATLTERDAKLWEEEVVEIFLDPAGAGRDYAEVEISPANVVCDLIVREPSPSLASDASWHWRDLESKVVSTALDDLVSWTAVAVLPWTGAERLSDDAARRVPPADGDRWRFNVFRIKRPRGPADPERDAVYAAWSVPDGPSFHVPSVFRDLVFVGRAPAG